jgi:hypothetical protein
MSRTDPLAVRFFIIVLFFSGVAGEGEKRVADDDGRHKIRIWTFNNLTRMSRGRAYTLMIMGGSFTSSSSQLK